MKEIVKRGLLKMRYFYGARERQLGSYSISLICDVSYICLNKIYVDMRSVVYMMDTISSFCECVYV